MHSSRMRTARSLIVSPYLVISHACPPRSNHACPPEQPCTPPSSNYACTPWSNHAHPWEQPHIPPRSIHTCLPLPEQPCMPPLPEQPCMPPLLEQPCRPPPRGKHTHPWGNHTCPPEQPCTAPRGQNC